MSRIVMKFGGTSVGSIDRIQNVSNIVKSVYDEGLNQSYKRYL